MLGDPGHYPPALRRGLSKKIKIKIKISVPNPIFRNLNVPIAPMSRAYPSTLLGCLGAKQCRGSNHL
jgi:hypothetical protein